MRHQKAGRKFGRNTSHRRAMFRNLAGNFILHERIETTDAKAKELRRIAERLLSRALRLGDDLTADVGKLKSAPEREALLARRLHAQREVARFLPRSMAVSQKDGSVEDVDLVHKLFHDLAPRYLERVKQGQGGGYTRIIKGKFRRGDNAPMSFIEFISGDVKAKKLKSEGTEASSSASSQADAPAPQPTEQEDENRE